MGRQKLMGKVTRLNRNSFNAKLYCLFYGIKQKVLPKNKLKFKIKLALAYVLFIPMCIILLPSAILEYMDYRRGNFHFGEVTAMERFYVSGGIYIILSLLFSLMLPIGMIFFASYDNIILETLNRFGLAIWLTIAFYKLFKIIQYLFLIIADFIYDKLNPIGEDIKWEKEDKDFKAIIEKRQIALLEDRDWYSVLNTQGNPLWFKKGNESSPMTLKEAYQIESQAFIAERIAEQQKKDENNE